MKDKYKIPRKRCKVRQTRKNSLVALVKKEVKHYEKKNTEFKQFSLSVPSFSLYGGSAGASIVHLTAVPQGNTDGTRVGDELTLNSIHIRGIIFNGVGATANLYNDVRVIIFQYNNLDNAPLATEVLLTNSIFGSTVVSAYSSRQIDYLAICHSLYDKTYHVEGGVSNAANYANTGINTKHFEIKVPMKWAKKKIQFQTGTTGCNNGIWMLVIGSSASVATNPQMAYVSTVSYTDA